MKKFTTIVTALLCSISLFAQLPTGGIKATVVNRAGRAPIAGAEVKLIQGESLISSLTAAEDGKFLFQAIPDGSYTLEIDAPDFTTARVNVIVEQGLVRDLIFVTMSAAELVDDNLDASNFAEFDMDDSGYDDAPTILYGSNDVYTDMVGYGFSSIRFKNRGYNSESQDVYLAGVPLNDAVTGYTPFSLWSGLNEAMRSSDSSIGMESSDYGVGRYNGMTNFHAIPSAVRPGWRFSILSNSALYRLRLMASYSSGELDNGWSYAFNASARLGGNDWVEGLYYRNFAIYFGVGKRFDYANKLSLFAFVTPGQRGAQNASTQEVYDLMGDNMYNSNWGYQNGKVRNSRVRKTFEPVVALKYEFTPSADFKAESTLLFRGGHNGYTALDWYDAQDPRPDYYRNLPSYFYMEDEDYNRVNVEKAEWAKYAWTNRDKEFANYQHLNWDRLYNVNYNNPDGRSKYALEERSVDQRDLNLVGSISWNATNDFTLKAGFNAKYNTTEHYKLMNDLLGGDYYLNIDSFAERDFASNEALVQNDLDYFLSHGEAQKITQGGKYGYDYLAHIRKAKVWATGLYKKGGFSANLSATAGYESFWREGLYRKGLFAGLDDKGKEISYGGKVLTSYDSKGNVISSKGNSAVSSFFTYSAKLGLAYELLGGHRFSANVGYFNDAPSFNQAFVSARTRNSLVDGLSTIKTLSADINYQLSNNGYNLRATAFYTNIADQTDVMSFYDDSQHSFTNFAMTGIDQRHIGVELGFEVPLFFEGFSLSGVLSAGEYVYTSNPHMVQTVDNNAEIIRDEQVPYWKSHPKYKIAGYIDGRPVYDEDINGNFIVDGEQKHYVPSTPQFAAALGLNYSINYWFFELTGQYFAKSYLDMNPLYRTAFACGGGDGIVTPEEVEYMAAQEEFSPAFLLNCSIGKSWYIGDYNLGFSLQVNNMLNNLNVKTGGYEQTRLISSYGKDRYYRFDPKYFYMQGANYMLNIYFRF